jgi:hypothetical protein
MKLLCLAIIAVCLVSTLEASPGPIFDNMPAIKYASQSLNKFFSLFIEKENFMSTQHRQRYSVIDTRANFVTLTLIKFCIRIHSYI